MYWYRCNETLIPFETTENKREKIAEPCWATKKVALVGVPGLMGITDYYNPYQPAGI